MFFPSFLFITAPCLPPLAVDSESRGVRLQLFVPPGGSFPPQLNPPNQPAKPPLAALAGRPKAAVPTKPSLANDLNSHRPRCPADALDCRLDRRGVQVGHLLLGDVLDLLGRHLADFVLVRRARSLGDAGGALQQDR